MGNFIKIALLGLLFTLANCVPSLNRRLNECPNNARAKNELAAYMEELEDVYVKEKGGSRRNMTKICHDMEKVSGIQSESIVTSIGKFISLSDVKKWQNWYRKADLTRIGWDNKTQEFILCDQNNNYPLQIEKVDNKIPLGLPDSILLLTFSKYYGKPIDSLFLANAILEKKSYDRIVMASDSCLVCWHLTYFTEYKSANIKIYIDVDSMKYQSPCNKVGKWDVSLLRKEILKEVKIW